MKTEYIYVLDKDGSPLMPTRRRRHMMAMVKRREAEIVSEVPFVVRLCYQSPGIVQPLFGGTDPGRTNIGEAVLNHKGQMVYRAQVCTRNREIVKLMTKRRQHRQASRRGERLARKRLAKKLGTTLKHLLERKLPGYHDGCVCVKDIINTEARFNNRCRPDGWLTPSARQLVQTHARLAGLICSILPVRDWSVEINRFAFLRLTDGSCFGTDFQNGKLKGYPSIRAYLADKQENRCAVCGGPMEHIHHIVPRHLGGSNTVDNLIGLCMNCHKKVHSGEIKLDEEGLKKRFGGTSVLNQALPYIIDAIMGMFGKDHTHLVSGYETKQYREAHKIEKDHNLDAAVIAACGSGIKTIDPDYPHCFAIQQFRRHDRAMIRAQYSRSYKLDGKTVCKNRKKATEQKTISLAEYREKYPGLVAKLTVVKSKRYYNDRHRILPGAVFYFEGKRYVKSGQLSGGQCYRAVGYEKKNFPAGECTVVRQNTGLVYIC